MELWNEIKWLTLINMRKLELQQPQELAELYAMRAQAKVALGDLVGKPMEAGGSRVVLRGGTWIK